MANMSYCRFTNTSDDLTDCIIAIQDANEGGYPISEEERIAGKRMFRKFLNCCIGAGIIDEYDNTAIDSLFDDAEGEDDE